MDETPIYDSIEEVVQKIQNGEIDGDEVTVHIDNDYSEAIRENPEDFDEEYPDSIVDDGFVHIQVLATDEKLPYATLIDVLKVLGIETKRP